MSILSDATIRGLCQKPILPYTDFLAEVRADQALVAEQEAATTHPYHPAATLELKLQGIARDRYLTQEFGMIYPFSPVLIRTVEDRKIISKGTTSYGYDVSLTDDIKIFTNINATEIDPKRFDSQNCLAQAEVRTDVDGGRYVLIPPHSYMLGSTVEYFRVPRDVMIICVGKSTYARSGAIVNTTPIEPGFEGNVVIEISNSTPSPMRVYLNEGIAQFLFYRGDRPCKTSYGDRGGKYQGQRGVTLPKV